MSTISLRLPESYHRGVQEIAKTENVSMNQWIASAVAEKLTAMQTVEYLEKRAKRANREKFEAALAQVPDVAPEPFDSMGSDLGTSQ